MFCQIVCVGQDGTLIGTKGTATFPVNEDDWRYFSKKVPKELQAFHKKGFKIVIFRCRTGSSARVSPGQAQHDVCMLAATRMA